ncbi:dipeptidyl peptidase IV [Neoasaia chiangmaiensis NBRC 101099]|nr:DPP IV N-terminal domain-containing protein [Neoasaia chiangmaiensis]GBR40974.1 dipeptidyl peptidase IV [Neoasaia chiangmaiensis NBRC 101099]GEN13663.1 peptidase [Neoasaia chiangmaiensis]
MPTGLFRRALIATTAAMPLFAHAAPATDPARTCFADLAVTRNGTLGLARNAELTPDGKAALFLRSGPRDTTLHLYRFDLADHSTHELGGTGDAPEHLSVEEKARRERARQSLSGITAFDITPDGRTAIATRGGQILQIDIASGATKPVPGEWIAPRLSPDGRTLAVVRNDDLYTLDLATSQTRRLTTGGTADMTHGLAEFAAAEELQRPDGTWWSPDGSTLLYEEADSRNVEKHFIANPEHPQTQPVDFRYPRAGTDNARLRLGLVAAQGGTTRWVDWDSNAYPYLDRVVWRKDGGLFVLVANRAENSEKLLSVDPRTGRTATLLTENDTAWLDLTPSEGSGGLSLPYALPDGHFLWAAQRSAHWQLELHKPDGTLERVLTPQTTPFVSLLDVDPARHSAVIGADPSRIDTQLLRLDWQTGQITPLVITPGRHGAHFTKDLDSAFVDSANTADGVRATHIVDATGQTVATLPDVAEPLPFSLHTTFTQAGPLNLDALIVRPQNFRAGHRYPVILSVYAGPGYKQVNHTPASYAEDQCLADHGYIVVSLDGRGTPGRDHDFERATKNNLIDLPLQDQVDGLRALGKRFPEFDMSRVGVYGWSFGGYFTAMATIRRPDVFKAGVAGAPPVDFADYDTAYTERFLGTPQDDPEGYRKSNVLTYADQLARPLLIMHGITDDNVYFENTMKLTQALLKNGKSYDLLLLPGTHMLTDPTLRQRVDQAREAYFAKVLRPAN